MATHDDIGLSQPAGSTTTHRLDAIRLDANSTIVLREVMVVGSPETTNALTAVLNAAPASTAWGMAVRVVGGPSSVADFPVRVAFPSTATDNPVSLPSSQTINVRSSAANHLVTAYQSSAADLNVTVAGYVAPSTTVTVNGNVSSNSSVYLPVRLTNGTAFLTPALDYVHGSTFTLSSVQGPAVILCANSLPTAVSTGQFVAQWATPNGAAVQTVVTSSGASVMDSTEGAIKVNVVAGAAGGSTAVTVRQSTAGDLLATVNQGSTLWSVQVSTGAVSVSTGSITIHQGSTNFSVQVSTGAVSISTGVIRAQNYTSSGGAIEGSTTTPLSGVLGLNVRPVPSSIQSTVIDAQSSNSTVVIQLLSSGAFTQKVHAYFIGASTSGNVSTVVFLSSGSGGDAGAAKNRWAVTMGSGVFGANLAVSPPGFLFRTDVNEALNCRIESASTRIVARIALSWVAE